MVRLTEGLDMTIAVDWDVKHQIKQTNKISVYAFLSAGFIFIKINFFEKILS